MTIHPGARPEGVTSESQVADQVRGLFDSIAPSYDLLNHLLSMGLDRRWWSRAARTFRPILQRPHARVLDLCCGTGDMTAALLAHRPSSPDTLPILGLDFSSQMLDRARLKFPAANALWVQADALHLPYPDASFDLVTAAFGFRNLSNYAAGWREIVRVLRPGGQVGVLDCNQPEGLSGALYNLYLHHGLPLIGGLISGQPRAYAYLPASIARFPRPHQMLPMMLAAGLRNVRWDGYLLRAAGLYVGTR